MTTYGKAWDEWLDKNLNPSIRQGYSYELAQNAFCFAWDYGWRAALNDKSPEHPGRSRGLESGNEYRMNESWEEELRQYSEWVAKLPTNRILKLEEENKRLREELAKIHHPKCAIHTSDRCTCNVGIRALEALKDKAPSRGTTEGLEVIDRKD
jgi:hypothetical protein